MTTARLCHEAPLTAIGPLNGPLVHATAGRESSRSGPELAVDAGSCPAGVFLATLPGTSPCPARTTRRPPASQPEFYQYFGLTLLALIAISVLVAARG
jgi:hypothetical protein